VKRHISEWDVIALLQSLLVTERGKGIELGIGDDAAILRSSGGRLAWTVDSQLEGVHFRREWLSLEDLGWRSFVAAASDLAAMGARPVAALACLELPAGTSRREVGALGRGQAAASRALSCPVVGGNVARGHHLAVTTTVLGEVERPMRRDGAKVGDALWLVGDLGLAALGCRVLQGPRRRKGKRASRAIAACCHAWRRPRPLVAEGLRLARRARAAIDVSDGVAGDAAQLAAASGVRVVLFEKRLRAALRPELVAAAAELGLDPLAVALQGGEDYALLLTGAGRAPKGARTVGTVERGSGVFVEDTAGARVAVRQGFDHFRK
jgi:thiamine-monophosphate kinase